MEADWRGELDRWLLPFVTALQNKTRRRMCPAMGNPDKEKNQGASEGNAFLYVRRLCIEIEMRLILAILVVLSLMGSPDRARAAPSATCTMVGAAEGTAPDHEKMACCTPDCATPAPAAVMPAADIGRQSIGLTGLIGGHSSAGGLLSALIPMDDPPPRPFFG